MARLAPAINGQDFGRPAVSLPYAHRCAIAFVASGCALGALCGWTWDVLRNRRKAGG